MIFPSGESRQFAMWRMSGPRGSSTSPAWFGKPSGRVLGHRCLDLPVLRMLLEVPNQHIDDVLRVAARRSEDNSESFSSTIRTSTSGIAVPCEPGGYTHSW